MSFYDYIVGKALTYGFLEIKRPGMYLNLYNKGEFVKESDLVPVVGTRNVTDPAKISESVDLFRKCVQTSTVQDY